MTDDTCPRPSAALLSPLSGPSAAGQLERLQRDFPGHQIWREILPGRTRYVARRTRPGPGPHTVVTGDLTELRTALATARHPAPAARPAADD